MKLSEQVLDLLEASKQDYINMLTSVWKFYKEGSVEYREALTGQMVNVADEARTRLKRRDRIVWYLRYARLGFLDRIDKPSFKEEYERLAQKSEMPNQVRMEASMCYWGSQFLVRVFDKLTHYLSLGIPKIDEFVFSNQPWGYINSMFGEWEVDWQADHKGTVASSQWGDGELSDVITFPDGWKWVMINKEWCEVEGKAMGHCGNRGNPLEGDRILSLRQPRGVKGGEERWEIHCTFILRKDGYLGEMKGKENDKPVPKYYPRIVKLLVNPIVKGIRGGGYLPEHNFDPADLSPEQKEEVLSARPGFKEYLLTLSEYYSEYGVTDGFVVRLNEKAASVDLPFDFLQCSWDGGLLALEEVYRSFTTFFRSFYGGKSESRYDGVHRVLFALSVFEGGETVGDSGYGSGGWRDEEVEQDVFVRACSEGGSGDLLKTVYEEARVEVGGDWGDDYDEDGPDTPEDLIAFVYRNEICDDLRDQLKWAVASGYDSARENDVYRSLQSFVKDADDLIDLLWRNKVSFKSNGDSLDDYCALCVGAPDALAIIEEFSEDSDLRQYTKLLSDVLVSPSEVSFSIHEYGDFDVEGAVSQFDYRV